MFMPRCAVLRPQRDINHCCPPRKTIHMMPQVLIWPVLLLTLFRHFSDFALPFPRHLKGSSLCIRDTQCTCQSALVLRKKLNEIRSIHKP